MIISNIKEIKQIKLENLPLTQVYMYPINLKETNFLSGECEIYNDIINQMISVLPKKEGRAFITIDSKIIEAGKTHRRPGKHVDGNFIFDWGGGGGWLTGSAGRYLKPKDHYRQYCDNFNGGTLIVSDAVGCKAWDGLFKGYARQGGDCSHIETGEGFLLKPNFLYFMNSTGIHESIIIDQSIKRTLVRITLPPVSWKI